jgi:hypothetical protein
MEIIVCKTLSEALEKIMEKDKEYERFVRHFLGPGKGFRLHRHEKANEWVIVESGAFDAFEGNEGLRVKVGKQEVAVIHFSKNKCHTLKAITNLNYYVLGDKKDKIIYC